MDITVAIPTHNAAQTMRVCLDKLQVQRIPDLKVLVYDNGSRDGTFGMMSELMANKYYAIKPALDKYSLDITFFQGKHDDKISPYQNGWLTKKLLGKLITTKYIFFLDPDVLIPPNAIPMMIEEFEKHPDAGFMGIQYEPDAKHVMFGSTIWKTEVFNKIGEWDGVAGGCDCNFAKIEVEKMGLKSTHHPTLLAYHYKYF